MSSQKYWEEDVQISDGSDDHSESVDHEEEILTKLECEQYFREEVRDWLDKHGKDLFGDGMPIPKLTKTNNINTPYKPPYKKQKAMYLNETQEIKKFQYLFYIIQ